MVMDEIDTYIRYESKLLLTWNYKEFITGINENYFSQISCMFYTGYTRVQPPPPTFFYTAFCSPISLTGFWYRMRELHIVIRVYNPLPISALVM